MRCLFNSSLCADMIVPPRPGGPIARGHRSRVFQALSFVVMIAAMATSCAAAPMAAAAIEQAEYADGPLPPGQSPLTAKIQILLDRAGISTGVIDGYRGAMSASAIRAFERRKGFAVDGVMDRQIWDALQKFTDTSLTQNYVITAQDAAGLTRNIPDDYLEKANMTSMAHSSIAERLGERFHMDEDFIADLNPGAALSPGASIQVIDPGRERRGTVTRILVDKGSNRVSAYDKSGALIADYPATIGSQATPSPSGQVSVTAIALNPVYTYNPRENFTQGANENVLEIPPGPNGPVGNVWIGLSRPSYGIHGTATPSRLFLNQSNGCVRLTNWDAAELAHMVKVGATQVRFLEPGEGPPKQ